MALFKQDDIIELSICAYGASGEGIAKRDGFVFFVPYAVTGELVKCKITHVNVKKGLVFCELREVLSPSEDRVKPICNRFTRCGGCDMMHLNYAEQLRIKKDNLVALFRKNAQMDVEIDDVVPSTPLGYRNKIQLPFGTVNGEVAMGFFRENSHKIVSITKCFLHGEWVETFIRVCLDFAKSHRLTAYDDVKKKGLLRHLVVRKLGDSYCVVVVTNGEKLPYAGDLVRRLSAAIGDSYALYNSVKKSHDNVILGESVSVIKEKEVFADVLGIRVRINPYSFLQLNDEIRDKIYSRVIEEILQKDKPVVIDAYAGVGVLGAIMAKRGATVTNIEIVPEATADGIALVRENGLDGKVTNINGDAAVLLPKLLSEHAKVIENSDLGNPNDDKDSRKLPIVVLDPPRKGCDERVLRAINAGQTDAEVYYISCNPATLTRDLKILAEGGFRVEYVTPYDMFPQTCHVETLVKLIRK